MLRKKLSLETFVKNIRNRMPLKQVPRKSATKNNEKRYRNAAQNAQKTASNVRQNLP